MSVHDIEFIELYVERGPDAVDHFVSGFGYAETARSVDEAAGRDSVLLCQGESQIVVTSGRIARAFLAEHGDGVVDIALACDDLSASWERAVGNGAAALRAPAAGPGGWSAVVSGFGDVRHTLVAREPGSPAGPPADRVWRLSARPERFERRVVELDHVAVALPGGTLRETVKYYGAAFGLDEYSTEYITVGTQAMDSIVVRSGSAKVTFTLIEPDLSHEPGQIDRFLEANGGAGVQHLALLTDDIVAAITRCAGHGVDFLTTPTAYYDLLTERLPEFAAEIARFRDAGVLADRDEFGHLLQLFTRSPYERRTLFYELIQRLGARGFGTSNIKALYEAVEHEQSGVGGA